MRGEETEGGTEEGRREGETEIEGGVEGDEKGRARYNLPSLQRTLGNSYQIDTLIETVRIIG